jgi:hypothetical protein
MKIILTQPRKSPFPGCPYIAELELPNKSTTLTWAQVKALHKQVREICPQRFAWWVPLPQEVWFCSLIWYAAEAPTQATLPTIAAMRCDLMDNRQFENLNIPLTAAQLITLRKWLYRCHSDWRDYADRGAKEIGM